MSSTHAKNVLQMSKNWLHIILLLYMYLPSGLWRTPLAFSFKYCQLGLYQAVTVVAALDDHRVLPDQVKLAHLDLQKTFTALTNGGEKHE